MNKQHKKGLVPKLRFPEFTDAGEWELKRLGEIAEYQNGQAHEQDIEESGTFIVVNSKFISTDGETKKFTNTAFCLAKKKDVLIVLSDVPNGRAIGKCFLVNSDNLYTVNQRICKITPKKVVSKMLFYILNRNPYFLAFDDGVKQTNLRKDDVLNFSLFLPKEEKEQQKIADCLSSLDELITAENQKLDSLKTHKKGLMQGLFPAEGETVPKLRFPEFVDAGEWKETQLQKIARPVADRAVTGDGDNVLSLSSEHGLVLQSDYFGKRIAGDSAERYLKLLRNDFVYNDRTTKASIFGTIKRLSKYSGGIVSPIYKCFRFHSDENPVFWEWYFESGTHHNQLGNLVNEGARAGRFNISISQFLSTTAWRPDEPEQQKIADCLTSIDELITAQAQKIEALKLHKKGLMQGLFPPAEEISQ